MRERWIPSAVLAALVAATAAAVALALLVISVGAPPTQADSSQEAEMRAIARELACPVCQGLSVADSPSPLAAEMRAVILQKLDQGETRDQIIAYFVDRYGESILFSPPKRGFTLLIWWVPFLALAAGMAIVGVCLYHWLRAGRAHRPGAGPGDGPGAGVEAEALRDPELAAYLPRLEAELRRWREATR